MTRPMDRDAYLERIRMLDEELIEDGVRRSLLSWLRLAPPDELSIALELLRTAFDAADHETSTMLWLIDRRFLPHLAWLRDMSVTLLELVWTDAQSDPGPIIDRLAKADEARRRQILAELPVPNRGFHKCHEIFRAAWEVAPRSAHYREPIHRGEPTPELRTRERLELAVFLANRLAPRLTAWEAAFAAAMARARKALAEPPVKKAYSPRPVAQDPPALLDETIEQYLQQPKGAGSSWAVRLLAETTTRHQPSPEAREFLQALDEELRRLDVVRAFGAKGKSVSPVVSAIYRAENLWFARLADGNYALLFKRGRRATWVRGGHDEVLASVPDEHFEHAVAAANASEPESLA